MGWGAIFLPCPMGPMKQPSSTPNPEPAKESAGFYSGESVSGSTRQNLAAKRTFSRTIDTIGVNRNPQLYAW